MHKLLGNNRFWCFVMLLLLLICAIAAYALSQAQPSSRLANIYQDGRLIRTIDLAQIKEETTFVITAANGGSNTIAVAPGKISVQEASCPDHVCIKQGWISDSVYPIVCLPNKLVIRIEGEETDSAAPDVMSK